MPPLICHDYCYAKKGCRKTKCKQYHPDPKKFPWLEKKCCSQYVFSHDESHHKKCQFYKKQVAKELWEDFKMYKEYRDCRVMALEEILGKECFGLTLGRFESNEQ